MGPLQGLVVVDAGNLIAGPMAGSLLGDYGATIIKVEHPATGDPLRHWEPLKDGNSLWWKVTARNKRLITLNLSRPEGRALFLRLATMADVVIENFRAGTFERWGLDYATLAADNPGLVLLRISGFGQTGPMSGKPGYGTIAEAMSGIPAFTGTPDGPPTLPGFPMADSVTGLFGAFACLAALHERQRTGKGQSVDIALYESLFRLVESQVIGYDQLGIVKRRVGNRLEEDAPRNTYRTADGRWVAISASSDRTWERLAAAIGRPELGTDARFVTSSNRVANVDELDRILSTWFEGLTFAEAMKRLDEQDVVAGPVLDVSEIFDHPQYLHRGNIVNVPDDDFGSVRMPAPVGKFSDTPPLVAWAGRALGFDNDYVYGELLGLDPVERDHLASEGVI